MQRAEGGSSYSTSFERGTNDLELKLWHPFLCRLQVHDGSDHGFKNRLGTSQRVKNIYWNSRDSCIGKSRLARESIGRPQTSLQDES